MSIFSRRIFSNLCKLPILQVANRSLIKETNFRYFSEDIPNEKFELADKVAVIVGGAGEIGYSIAHTFLRNGVNNVSILDKDVTKGEEAVDKLVQKFGNSKAIFYETEITDSKNVDAALRNTILHLNGIDIVVNCAGIFNDSKWEEQIQTNMIGTVVTTLLGLQHMSSSGPGHGGIVVNVASIMGVIPSLGYPLHTMTQYGIVGFSRALGCSDQYNRTKVKIVGYCPGPTDTKLFRDAANNSINPNFSTEFLQEIDGCVVQKPEKVAEGLCLVMETAKSGSIWVAENNDTPYEVRFPEVTAVNAKTSQAAIN
ncbi:unnamed protein product [Brassicogethes aeneus]|uniref:15-hydroxyprostaglandin dehydrogenase [NAD(+)]-like n=1 Tax=Brassicogethes aeneus TaxID=1431903 RepID=A0A9P0FBN3_BRAAE|nr:unnamed protein product [Brassicogethes aeneus]